VTWGFLRQRLQQFTDGTFQRLLVGSLVVVERSW
jgi:hypothetical protein